MESLILSTQIQLTKDMKIRSLMRLTVKVIGDILILNIHWEIILIILISVILCALIVLIAIKKINSA